jgi:hypothetical protein
MIYYSYVHSLLSYGIIFWGNAPHNENIFKIQKRILRAMTGSGRLDSCCGLFKKLHILPLQSQYISSVLFVVKNKNYFRSNTAIHDINTRFNHNLHLPLTNLSVTYSKRTPLFIHVRSLSDVQLQKRSIYLPFLHNRFRVSTWPTSNKFTNLSVKLLS